MRTMVFEEGIESGESILEGRASERGGAFAAHYVSINEAESGPGSLVTFGPSRCVPFVASLDRSPPRCLPATHMSEWKPNAKR